MTLYLVGTVKSALWKGCCCTDALIWHTCQQPLNDLRKAAAPIGVQFQSSLHKQKLPCFLYPCSQELRCTILAKLHRAQRRLSAEDFKPKASVTSTLQSTSDVYILVHDSFEQLTPPTSKEFHSVSTQLTTTACYLESDFPVLNYTSEVS